MVALAPLEIYLLRGNMLQINSKHAQAATPRKIIIDIAPVFVPLFNLFFTQVSVITQLAAGIQCAEQIMGKSCNIAPS